MTNPLASVVTITYNLLRAGRADVFGECAASVRRQTYPAVEHLVADGGSTDGTVDLLERHARRGELRYESEPDTGIYDAMNKGLRMAAGKYVAFLNSDDFWHDPDAVAASVRALESSGADFSYGAAYVVSERVPVRKLQPRIGAFFLRMPACHQTVFVRRDAMLALGGFDTAHFRSAGDFDFMLRLGLSGRAGVEVPGCIASYREGGFSADASLSEDECVDAILRRYGALAPLSREEAWQAYHNLTMREDVFAAVRGAAHPDVRRAMDRLRRDPAPTPGLVRFSKTVFGELLAGEIDENELASFNAWGGEEITCKIGGVPVARIRRGALTTRVSVLGIPILRKTIR